MLCMLVLSAALAGCCCCSWLPPRSVGEALSRTAAAAGPCVVGERCEAEGIVLTVHSATRVAEMQGSLPAPGKVFLLLNLTLSNSGRDRASYSPAFFRMTDPSGGVSTSAAAAPPPGLGTGELRLGEHVTGNLAFEVEAGGKGLLLWYEPPELVGCEPLRIIIAP